MKKKCLAVGIILLFIGVAVAPTIHFATVNASTVDNKANRVTQKELVFQTICDIVNNKEIQQIILKSQICRGISQLSEIPILTKNQLKQMCFIGLILSKIINTAKMHSMIEKYQFNNQAMQKEITAVIQKNTTLKNEIIQLPSVECDCENENIIQWNFPILCALLFPLMFVALILEFSLGLIFLGEIIWFFHELLNCLW